MPIEFVAYFVLAFFAGMFTSVGCILIGINLGRFRQLVRPTARFATRDQVKPQ